MSCPEGEAQTWTTPLAHGNVRNAAMFYGKGTPLLTDTCEKITFPQPSDAGGNNRNVLKASLLLNIYATLPVL